MNDKSGSAKEKKDTRIAEAEFSAAAAEAKQMQERGAVHADSEFGLWLAWARHKADWIDPLVKAHCEVLDDQ